MRTTVILPDALAEEAKRHAADSDRTFTSLVEEGLRLVLALPATPGSTDLPSASLGAAQIDILDKDALWQVFDERDRE